MLTVIALLRPAALAGAWRRSLPRGLASAPRTAPPPPSACSRSSKPSSASGPFPRLETQSTVIEEGEVNAYLEHYLRAEIPPGISTPTLRILGDNRLSATATLDLDAMNASRPPSDGFDPLRVLQRQPAGARSPDGW